MRHLRVFSVVLFVISLAFTIWSNIQYLGRQNSDFPVFTNEFDLLEISVEDGDDALLKGLSAHDATDGDLTEHIMIASTSHFLEPGLVNVKYVVFDTHSNSATLTRKVRYTDYRSPQFTLSKAPVYVEGENFDLLDHIQVKDVLDGNISDQVRILSNAVSNFNEGVYPVVLEVSNSCGDTARLELLVTYLNEANTANIQLTQHIVYLPAGEEFDPDELIESVTDAQGNTLNTRRVTVKGNLDTETPGYYTLTYHYNYRDIQGQSAITVVVTEEVEEDVQ